MSILFDMSIATPEFFYFHLHAISFSIPSLLVCMCHRSEVGGSLVDSIYMGLVFLSIQPVYLLVAAFNPFTFKTIIDMYVPVAFFLHCFHLFL